MKKLLPLFILLTACGQAHIEPIKQYVYCLTPDQFAALVKKQPAKVGQTLTGDARKDSKILGENNVLLRQHDDGLLEVLGKCVG